MVIPEGVRRELEAHAHEALPNEACGLVLLEGDRAIRYVPGTNALASPYRFDLHLDAETWADIGDTDYRQAIFHSHPETPPFPSRTDIENIGLWEGEPYLIMRADTGELRAFVVDGGEVSELPLSS